MLALIQPAAAQVPTGLTFTVEGTNMSKGYLSAVVKVSNSTDTTYANVFGTCAFLNAKNRAIGTAKFWSMNVARGSDAYEDVSVDLKDEVSIVQCRIDLVY